MSIGSENQSSVMHVRKVLISTILSLFIAMFLLLAFSNIIYGDQMETLSFLKPNTQPGFGNYVRLRTLPAQQLALDDPTRRVIIVGDIHGMLHSLDSLLRKLSYDESKDLLVHLGDIVTKGPDSLALLSRFSAANITGIRGNHDQTVIEWRAWIIWIESQKGGREWLLSMERKNADSTKLVYPKHKGNHHWKIPHGWVFNGPHYLIARKMSARDYDYLLSLPLILHLPSLHTYLVHAGLLPVDPTRSHFSPRQPLSHLPKIVHSPHRNATLLRRVQELALTTDIPQNLDPWVLLNMRSILPSNEISRNSDQGKPWPDLWNNVMSRCAGYDLSIHSDAVLGTLEANTADRRLLPCRPITVVYGHTASRGLDLKRWSVGLDTGCVYRRRLTALVIGKNGRIDSKTQRIKFGETGTARLISVKC